MIGSLMYLTASRPDIMLVVYVCARFQVRPKDLHLQAVKRIFRYLKGQPRLGLWYPYESPFELLAYIDGDYGGASLDRKATSGGCQFLGARLTIVSTSTAEAEYVAAAQCCSQHSKTKHIQIKYHFIRDSNEKKLIHVLKVHTDYQYADLFTKAFDVGRFKFLITSLLPLGDVSIAKPTIIEERKVFDLKSVNLSKKISELERKIILDKKNSLKKPSLRIGKYQNMMLEFEEEIQVVHSERKVVDKKSIGLQKQIVDLQNQLSDERSQFKRKEKVLQQEKSVLEQIIAEPKKKSVEEKDFENQKVLFENEIKKLTSKLSGLSTDIMNEQRMRSDQQQKLDDLLEERNKLSAKVKELEEIVFKVNLTEQRSPDVILQSSYNDDTNSVCSFKTAHDFFHVDVAPRRKIKQNLFATV
ncbi:hypothetical protein OSB04_011862 [Centaurea solstitialis]|uniref:Uncharacterized protein n=1 Tax=Centaurea solstitialis TaxID=347529 RepID=A0AA38TAA2_9ASTR|nr:hypothetical protein OSB04_011862 [Centaurea solstitialis]